MAFHHSEIICVLVAGLLSSCTAPGVRVSDFGSLSSGEQAHLYTIRNASGASVELSDFGARIISVNVPDRNGKIGDVVVGYRDVASFETTDRFVGCILGRFANRINGATFCLDGRRYGLDVNEERDGITNHLHGGTNGFDTFVWDAEILDGAVRFHRLSPDGEQGYPGNLECSVTYSWSEDNCLKIEYEATTDAPTVVNLSNHTYFNPRSASGDEYVMSCELWVDADSCIINDSRYIPDQVVPVEGTALDFNVPYRMDQKMEGEYGLKVPVGSWLVSGWDGSLHRVADLYDRHTGRGIETWTTEPNLLTFAARSWTGTRIGKYGPLEKYCGMLFETLHPADSPNQPRFPSTVLRPGEKYYSCTQYRFYSK